MISEILATAHKHIHHAADKLDDYRQFVDPLSNGDTAQWAAGLMYAYTKQTVDVRDALVGCAVSSGDLDRKMSRAYKKYGNGKYRKGNQKILNSEDYWRESFASCDQDIQDMYDEMANTSHAFFDMDGWEDIVSDNYNKNKALVDSQWQFGLTKWSQGVYFDAGMFYGNAWRVLVTGALY